MSQCMKYTPILNQKQNTIYTVKNQKNDNKKVISSLKEQMSNIRQGMSKLLKIKSEENLRILQINNMSGKQTPVASKVPTSSKNGSLNLETKETQQMQEKIKNLQEENLKLHSRVNELENKNSSEKSKYLKRQSQLQDQNTILLAKVKNLTDDLQKIKVSQNKLRRSSPKKSNNLKLYLQKQQLIETLNPQTQNHLLKQQITYQSPHYEHFIRQNDFLRKNVLILQQKTAKLESLYIQNLKLIDSLNEKLILAEFSSKASKYLKQINDDRLYI